MKRVFLLSGRKYPACRVIKRMLKDIFKIASSGLSA